MIKFVYFDVGGVVIKDFSATDKWKKLQYTIGVRPHNEKKFQEVWALHRNKICIDYNVDEMIPELNREVGLSISNDYSLLQGFVDSFEKNESIWPVIETIKKQAKIGLLTNMYVKMFKEIQNKGILPPVQWNVVIDSSIVKFQKPDNALFTLAQKKAGVAGNEILFIDNQEKHVNAAKECGWNTFLYDSSDYEKSSKKLQEYFDVSKHRSESAN